MIIASENLIPGSGVLGRGFDIFGSYTNPTLKSSLFDMISSGRTVNSIYSAREQILTLISMVFHNRQNHLLRVLSLIVFRSLLLRGRVWMSFSIKSLFMIKTLNNTVDTMRHTNQLRCMNNTLLNTT